MSIAPAGPDPDRPPFPQTDAQVDVVERRVAATSGLVGILALAICLAGAIGAVHLRRAGLVALAAACLLAVASSFVACQPGHAWVVQFFGRYVGTLRRPGLAWVPPLTTRRRISIRVRNFETARLRVNDADGNPIEIAAVVVWQVADTAKAVYAVDDYQGFVAVQAESALRQIATGHPYDAPAGPGTSLRGSTELVADELWHEVGLRVALAGVEVIEVRISHLAYAPEIAQALLRRQQASAVIDARSRIVEGAVGMVEMALDRLNESELITLDDERKAAMVSNLMVVLCSDQPTAPVVNTGTLYSG
jgi:regulator of protease activity HflC (stomatin/prohibitin superfamily)